MGQQLRKLCKGKSPDADWVASFKKRVSDTKFKDRNQEATIYRVPYILKMGDPKAYDPLIVSLGPYHRDKCRIRAMIQLKWKYLKFVVEQNHNLILEDYVCLIKNLEKLARDAYSELGEMNSNSFAEMMLLDGCFVMLTIMRWNIEKKSSSWTQFGRAIIERNFKTKISGVDTLLAQSAEVVRDIFLLENQLPFFLLETLYKSAFPRGPSFRMLTFEFISMHTSSNLALPSNNETFHHIIHLFHSCIIDPARNHGDGNDDQSAFGNRRVPDLSWIPSATVLHEAGIRLGNKEKDKSFLDITFHDGKLEIPQLQIDEHTNSFLRNLIAYEQCSTDSELHITSYMMLMNCLIRTSADVDLLQQHEIIIGDLADDSQKIAALFNKLGTYIGNQPADFYLEDVVAAMERTYREAVDTTTESTTRPDTTNDAQDIQFEEEVTDSAHMEHQDKLRSTDQS